MTAPAEMPPVKLPIGLGKGHYTGVLRIPQMPDHATTDNRRQIDLVSETAAVLLVSQEVGGQGQSTSCQHRHQPLVAKGTHETIEGHRGDVADDRAQFQTEPPVSGQQGIAGRVRTHGAIAQDEVREHREDRFACRALEAPDGDPTQPDTRIMRMAGQAPTAATGRLVLELKAKGYDEGDDTFEERLPIAKQLEVHRFASEIDGDGAVFSHRLSRCAHVSPLRHQVFVS